MATADQATKSHHLSILTTIKVLIKYDSKLAIDEVQK